MVPHTRSRAGTTKDGSADTASTVGFTTLALTLSKESASDDNSEHSVSTAPELPEFFDLFIRDKHHFCLPHEGKIGVHLIF